MGARSHAHPGTKDVAAARGLLFAVLALAPLPLAGMRPWAWSALALAVGLACLLWGTAALRGHAAILIDQRRSLPFALVFATFLAWCFLQTTPWLPETWAPAAWQRAAAALGASPAAKVAIDPTGARETAMRLLAYAGVFWLSLHFGRDSAMARRILWVLAVSGCAYAVYGLAAHLSGSQTILWLDKWHYPDSLTSTFVNRNSYATYAGLTLLACLALTFDRLARAGEGLVATPRGMLLALDNMTPAGWFLACALVAVGVALLLSQSRGGFVAFVIGLTGFALALRGARGRRRRFGPALLALMVAGGGVLVMFGGDLAGRVGNLMAGQQVERRAEIYALTAGQIAEHPWTGIGLGGFDDLYHAWRTDAFGTTKTAFERVHNTYMEVALEAGIPAFLTLLALLAALARRCVRGATIRRHNAVFPCLGVGATALVAAHSLVDFSLQIPAVSVTYAAILGTAVAQSWRHSRRPAPGSPAQGGTPLEAAPLPGGGEAAAQDRPVAQQAQAEPHVQTPR